MLSEHEWKNIEILKYEKLECKPKMTDILRDTFENHDRKIEAISAMGSTGLSLLPL